MLFMKGVQCKMRKEEIKYAFKIAFPYTIPVLTGFLILGMAYGVLMQNKGYGTLYALLMSAVAYCGSMQFVAITLLTIPFDPIQAFLLSLMVNARHLFYGLAMLDKYKGLGKTRTFLIYVLCDETFSIASSVNPPTHVNRKYFYTAISGLIYSYWILGTFIGCVAGAWITFNTQGLDFVLTALFVVLFIEQMEKKENHRSGIIGLLCTTIAFLIFKQDLVIPAMILILIVLTLGGRKKCT